MCPLSNRFRLGTLLRAEAVDDDGREAMIEADCKAKDLKTARMLYRQGVARQQADAGWRLALLRSPIKSLRRS